MTTLNYMWQKTAFTKQMPHCQRKHRLTLFNTCQTAAYYITRTITSDEFIDTNYYKQNKQNDDFELYVTKDRFYKAYGTLPTKTSTDFDEYVTAA